MAARKKRGRVFIRLCSVKRFKTQAEATAHAKEQAVEAGHEVGKARVTKVTLLDGGDAFLVELPVIEKAGEKKRRPAKRRASRKTTTTRRTTRRKR